MEAKKVFAIVIGVALLATAIGFIVTGNFFPHGDQGKFNYEHVFVGEKYGDITATDDNRLAIISVTVRNDSYNSGIDVVTLGWKLTTDGITFSQNMIFTPMLPKYLPITIEKGRTWEYEIAFEIPSEERLHYNQDKIKLDYVYVTTGDDLHMSYDANLKLPDSFIGPEMIATVPSASRF